MIKSVAELILEWALKYAGGGFLFFLAIKLLHHNWWPAIPEIGIWTSMGVVALVCIGYSIITSFSVEK